MALTIVATPGSASANSFATEAEADAYLEGRLNSDAWWDADAADRRKALVEAARELNNLPWLGTRTDATQVMEWPRDRVRDPDTPISDPGQDYPYYADDVVPDRVKDAQVELALEFLRAGSTDLAVRDPQLDVQSEGISGATSTQYVRPLHRGRGLQKFPRVLGRIAPLIESSREVARM